MAAVAVRRSGAPATTIVAAIVVLCVLVVAAVVVLAIGGAESRTTPAVATLIAVLAPTIAGLLALLRAERAEQAVDGATEELEKHDEKLRQLDRRRDWAEAERRAKEASE